MNAQILINCGKNWFEFSKSKTGQLDYVGTCSDVDGAALGAYRTIAASTYFSPSWYLFLADALNCVPVLYVASDVDISDAACFDFLVHVGALLCAVEARDSLLAGQLYVRRRASFEAFAQLTQYILEPLCVEILFSLTNGTMATVEPESVPLVFNAAKKKLEFDSANETLNQAFMRYFKQHEVTLTLEVVGTNHHYWEREPAVLDKFTDNIDCACIEAECAKIRGAKHGLYAGLSTVVQAEPYNRHDVNAIACFIEDIETKISGNVGLERVGYVRAFAAKVIREAKPAKLAFASKLVRLSRREVVLAVTV